MKTYILSLTILFIHVQSYSQQTIVSFNNFKYVFTQQLAEFIRTGDEASMMSLVQEDDITLIGLTGMDYFPSADKAHFLEFVSKYLDIRDENIEIEFVEKEWANAYYSPAGGMYFFIVFYSNSDRYDYIAVNYSNDAKLMGITINDNLHENVFVDGDLYKIYGMQHGPYGSEIATVKKME